MSEPDPIQWDLCRRGARDVAAAYKRHDVSPVEVTQASLASIQMFDGAVNAMVLTDAEGALAQAQAAEQRWAQGSELSPIDGLPVTIKDMFLTQGWPTLKGSNLVDASGPWRADAPVVARLRESGAVILGKTTTPEFGWKGVTDSIRHGSTGNPWSENLTSGGSSGGSATAVGLGMGVWSVGTDGGGSVRIPASFTGTVALKPTFGLVPAYPPSPYGTLSHVGPITRTVADAALMMDTLTGHDPRDWFAGARPQGSLVGPPVDDLTGVRIAFSPDLNGTGENDAQVDDALRTAVGVLADLGAEVVDRDPDVHDTRESFHVLWFTGAAKVLEPFGPGALDRIDPLLADNARRYGAATASEYLAATAARMDLGVTMGQFHEEWDSLVTATMPISAFARGQDAPDGWPDPVWTSWTPYTYPFNMTGQPALSVPCGFTHDRRPIGMQIVGARHGDEGVLRVGRAYESATSWPSRLPALMSRRNREPADSRP